MLFCSKQALIESMHGFNQRFLKKALHGFIIMDLCRPNGLDI